MIFFPVPPTIKQHLAMPTVIPSRHHWIGEDAPGFLWVGTRGTCCSAHGNTMAADCLASHSRSAELRSHSHGLWG